MRSGRDAAAWWSTRRRTDAADLVGAGRSLLAAAGSPAVATLRRRCGWRPVVAPHRARRLALATNDLIKRLIDAGLSFTQMTQAKAEEIVKEMQEAGQVRMEEAQSTVQELVDPKPRERREPDAHHSERDDQAGREWSST